MLIEKVQVSVLNNAVYNPRKDLKPTDAEYIKLKNSIEHFGYVEPIIVNKRNNTVVGGHQRLKVLKDLGFEDVDVVYVDLDDTDEKALNIALNKISGDWDIDKLEDLLNEIKLDSSFDIGLTGFSLDDIDKLFNNEPEDSDSNEDNELNRELNRYSNNIKIPQYTPTGKEVDINDCINLDKYNELVSAIDKSNVDIKIKRFLKLAATRHIVFNYKNIAELYANSNEDIQQLMEDSALVIIDFNDAIAKGYVKITKKFNEILSEIGNDIVEDEEDTIC